MSKERHNISGYFMQIRTVLRGLYGTDLRLNTGEERKRALDAITNMTTQAEALEHEAKAKDIRSPQTIEEALKTIAEDISNGT